LRRRARGRPEGELGIRWSWRFRWTAIAGIILAAVCLAWL
jgi:hypothetical protein